MHSYFIKEPGIGLAWDEANFKVLAQFVLDKKLHTWPGPGFAKAFVSGMQVVPGSGFWASQGPCSILTSSTSLQLFFNVIAPKYVECGLIIVQ